MSWVLIQHDGQTHRIALVRDRRGVWVGWPGGAAFFERENRQTASIHQHEEIRAPMTGKVVRVMIAPGDIVEQGAVLVILEAMKMEYRLTAPHAGTVEEVHCHEDDLVDLGATLVKLVE